MYVCERLSNYLIVQLARAFMMTSVPFLLIEPEDFSIPLYGGGGAAMAGHIVRFFKGDLAVVGATSADHTIGQWAHVDISGRRCLFLPVIHRDRLSATPIVSSNLRFAVALCQHRKALEALSARSVLSQTWAVLWFFAVFLRKWDICYYFPGFGNAMRYGRHPILGRILAKPYDILHSFALRRANVVLAAASQDAIMQYESHLRRLGTNIEVHALPTAVDTGLFKPLPKGELRCKLGLPVNAPIYIFVGRLAAVKGIPLILKALEIVKKSRPEALLLIVGDGEERETLVKRASHADTACSVRFFGMLPPEQVVELIACADAGLFASYTEGFSVAMVEQLACGRPIVTTEVSGVHDLITEGKNGFILRDRNADAYAQRMLDVLDLGASEAFSRRLAVESFSIESFWARFAQSWAPLRAGTNGTRALSTSLRLESKA